MIPLDPENDAEQREAITGIAGRGGRGLEEANEQMIVPDEDAIPAERATPEEVVARCRRGVSCSTARKANCIKCHGPTGLGDGQQDDYDNWQEGPQEVFGCQSQAGEECGT